MILRILRQVPTILQALLTNVMVGMKVWASMNRNQMSKRMQIQEHRYTQCGYLKGQLPPKELNHVKYYTEWAPGGTPLLQYRSTCIILTMLCHSTL